MLSLMEEKDENVWVPDDNGTASIALGCPLQDFLWGQINLYIIILKGKTTDGNKIALPRSKEENKDMIIGSFLPNLALVM